MTTVKPLEWEGVTCMTPIGAYKIRDGYGLLNGICAVTFAGVMINDRCHSDEQAKAAAQEDYERRILSAIEVNETAIHEHQECDWCVNGLQADGETPCPCTYPTFPQPPTVAEAAEAFRSIRELNMTSVDENGHRWANSDLIDQEVVWGLNALRVLAGKEGGS